VGWLKRSRDKNGDVDPVAWVGDGGEPEPTTPSVLLSAQPQTPSTPEIQALEALDEFQADRESASSAGEEGKDGDSEDEDADRATGPWDVSEVEASDAYVDLGGLWLPARDGMELRLEVEEESGRVIAATVQLGGSAVQLQAFAAPRTQGIWDEIRREIASSVTRQGGTADEMPGSFGRELLARVPTRTPDGRTTHQPARFVGIDGPRWFLRAVFHGEAAYQADQATDLESLVREVVVVRGTEAMAPRELLTLRLPEGAPGAEPEPVDDVESDGREPLRPPQRGPEITEVR
jgi:Protein of unknown function (DUF3710)